MHPQTRAGEERVRPCRFSVPRRVGRGRASPWKTVGAGPEAELGAGRKFPEGGFQFSAWKSFLAELFQDRGRLCVGREQNPVGAPVGEAERAESQFAWQARSGVTYRQRREPLACVFLGRRAGAGVGNLLPGWEVRAMKSLGSAVFGGCGDLNHNLLPAGGSPQLSPPPLPTLIPHGPWERWRPALECSQRFYGLETPGNQPSCPRGPVNCHTLHACGHCGPGLGAQCLSVPSWFQLLGA